MNIIRKSNLERRMDYPIGQYISDNLGLINNMSEAILKEFVNDKEMVVNLIVRGSSGSIISALVSDKMTNKGWDCKIYHIKKDGESSHSQVFSIRRHGVNIILDDFVSSGETVNAIYEKAYAINKDIVIDLLIVSGWFYEFDMNFIPKTIICGDMSSTTEVLLQRMVKDEVQIYTVR